MAPRKSGLGKGLDSLIPDKSASSTGKATTSEKKSTKTVEEEPSGEPIMVDIQKVEPNVEQPRKFFDEDALEELADSISKFGVLQPLLVQKRNGFYEIIAGERRWRAAKKAKLKEVPVLVRDYTEQERMEISLIENIQRENLNPIEEAQAYVRLLDEFHLRQEDVAERVSKSRSAVANSMRLLKLDSRVQDMLAKEEISTGHARALLAIEDADEQYNTAREVVEKKLSVRDIEKLVKKKAQELDEKKTVDKSLSYIYQDMEERLKNILGTKVSIKDKEGKGKIEIEYYSNEEFDRLVALINAAAQKK